MTADHVLSTKSIQEFLDDPSCFDIHIFESVTSTNDVLKEMALNGDREGTIVIAKGQTAGKGRKGRFFFSPSDTGLYVSILLRPKFSPTEIPLLTPMTAVVSAETIEKISNRKVDIKWVNDVMISGKKVCGILTEAGFASNGKTLDYVIIGIGINLLVPPNGFPEELTHIAGSVFSSRTDIRSMAIAELLNRFKKYYDQFKYKEFWTEYKKRLFFLGEEIEIISHNHRELATAVDINEQCHLVVRTQNGELKALDSGEISIKP